ncbi:MAG TPA: sigma-70 family RNA polymerase sigma factor [Oscillospiraceae bacterium]|nr:sigma-70 family RNA polymerase sigma factor [Oscillospiraceae bacterium]HPF55583.1 sigma-70 family RNA polymerase sigma factor [Clostridiales bacterium]HPK35818.1 sigma-70 family RNA polymerase sigma factor [Oscillospiraceae bacterium]HPR76336.1 sigma-70 family RNA polymerase sigma factor [Oscillospiraceae bacterium]
MDSFEKIYRDNAARVHAFLFALCGDPLLSEELTQETFFQAFSAFHRFQGKSELFTWLAAIAKHTYYKYLRKHKQGLDTINLDLVTDIFCRTSHCNPEDTVIRRVVCDSVKRLVRKLPEKYRDVVILRIYAEMPFAQVGEVLGISENSAKVIYFRAKKMLTEDLKNELEL